MHQTHIKMVAVLAAVLLNFASVTLVAGGRKNKKCERDERCMSLSETVAALQAQLRLQQQQIERLNADLAEQREILAERGTVRPASFTTTEPLITGNRTAAQEDSSSDPVASQEAQRYSEKVEELGKKVDSATANLGGFKFSGDFRFRIDGQLRSGNDIAAPLQNVRSRYRVRLNADKELDSKFKFHLQLSTGPFNVGTTNDQDMAGTIAKHPFSLAEAYVDYHASQRFSIRGGRMEEVFADNMRFLWDDDVRFNGFQQILTIPFGANAAGFKSIELRAGEYFLSNPNVAILTSSSPFVAAGFQTGQKVRDSNLFHPGFLLRQGFGIAWTQQFGGDFQYYRNPNEIQLASTANGFPVLVSNALGLTLSGPMSASGNPTTTPGGAIFTAPNFQIVRATYRLQDNGIMVGKRE